MRIGTSRCPRRRSRPAKSALDPLLSDQRPARRCRYRCERTDCRRHGRRVELAPHLSRPANRGSGPAPDRANHHSGHPPQSSCRLRRDRNVPSHQPSHRVPSHPTHRVPSHPRPRVPNHPRPPRPNPNPEPKTKGITDPKAKPKTARAKATVPKAAVAEAAVPAVVGIAVPVPAVVGISVPVPAVASQAIHAVVGITVPVPVDAAQHPATKAIPAITAVSAIAVVDGLGIVGIAVASVVWVIQVAVVATDIAIVGVPIESTRIIVVDAWIPVVVGIRTSEPAVDLTVHLGRHLGVGLVGQVVGGLGGFVNLSRGEESSAILEGAIPVAFLEGPAFGLADPMDRNPRPAGLRLGPEALLPDHAVLVGVVLSGNVEAIGSRRLTRVVIGTILGRAVLQVVQPVGLAVAPEAGDAIPAVLVALPVAIDPASTWRRHPPRPRYPDIILAAWVPLPVSLDPLGIGAGRIDGGRSLIGVGGALAT